MSKENKTIAEKIVAKYGQYSKDDHKAIDELDVDRTVHTIKLLNVAGIIATFHGDSKKLVTERAAEYVEEQLNDEKIILSDSWVEDNL